MELPSRLKVEVGGRVLGEFGLVETIYQAKLVGFTQNVPSGLFTAELVYEEGSKEYPNACGYKIGYPDITEMTLFGAKPIIYLYLSPPRDIGVYEGRPAGRIRKTVYFYG